MNQLDIIANKGRIEFYIIISECTCKCKGICMFFLFSVPSEQRKEVHPDGAWGSPYDRKHTSLERAKWRNVYEEPG